MSRATLVLSNQTVREKAARWAMQAKPGTRVEFKAPKRSLDQNSRLWACLTDIADQLDWHGQKLRTDEWKLLFMDALDREVKAIPALDGKGFVNLGTSSSDLSVGEMSDLLELINEFGARNGVVFHDREAA